MGTEKIAHPRFRRLTAKPKHFVCPIARLLCSATEECLPFRQTLLNPDKISTDHTLWRKDKIEPARPDCPRDRCPHPAAPMMSNRILLAKMDSNYHKSPTLPENTPSCRQSGLLPEDIAKTRLDLFAAPP